MFITFRYITFRLNDPESKPQAGSIREITLHVCSRIKTVFVFQTVYHKGCLVNMPFHCRESASCGNYGEIKLSVWITYIENLSGVCEYTP